MDFPIKHLAFTTTDLNNLMNSYSIIRIKRVIGGSRANSCLLHRDSVGRRYCGDHARTG